MGCVSSKDTLLSVDLSKHPGQYVLPRPRPQLNDQRDDDIERSQDPSFHFPFTPSTPISFPKLAPIRVTNILVRKSSHINQYKKIEKLGAGTYGKLFLYQDYEEQYYAIKKYNRALLKKKKIYTNNKVTKKMQVSTAYDKVEHEFRVLQYIHSSSLPNIPHVCPCYEIIDDPKSPTVYLVMAYGDLGTLGTWDSEQLSYTSHLSTSSSPSAYQSLFLQTLHGLSALRSIGVIHNDIKPQNIVLSREYGVLIVDFGEAIVVPWIIAGKIRNLIMDGTISLYKHGSHITHSLQYPLPQDAHENGSPQQYQNHHNDHITNINNNKMNGNKNINHDGFNKHDNTSSNHTLFHTSSYDHKASHTMASSHDIDVSVQSASHLPLYPLPNANNINISSPSGSQSVSYLPLTMHQNGDISHGTASTSETLSPSPFTLKGDPTSMKSDSVKNLPSLDHLLYNSTSNNVFNHDNNVKNISNDDNKNLSHHEFSNMHTDYLDNDNDNNDDNIITNDKYDLLRHNNIYTKKYELDSLFNFIDLLLYTECDDDTSNNSTLNDDINTNNDNNAPSSSSPSPPALPHLFTLVSSNYLDVFGLNILAAVNYILNPSLSNDNIGNIVPSSSSSSSAFAREDHISNTQRQSASSELKYKKQQHSKSTTPKLGPHSPVTPVHTPKLTSNKRGNNTPTSQMRSFNLNNQQQQQYRSSISGRPTLLSSNNINLASDQCNDNNNNNNNTTVNNNTTNTTTTTTTTTTSNNNNKNTRHNRTQSSGNNHLNDNNNNNTINSFRHSCGHVSLDLPTPRIANNTQQQQQQQQQKPQHNDNNNTNFVSSQSTLSLLSNNPHQQQVITTTATNVNSQDNNNNIHDNPDYTHHVASTVDTQSNISLVLPHNIVNTLHPNTTTTTTMMSPDNNNNNNNHIQLHDINNPYIETISNQYTHKNNKNQPYTYILTLDTCILQYFTYMNGMYSSIVLLGDDDNDNDTYMSSGSGGGGNINMKNKIDYTQSYNNYYHSPLYLNNNDMNNNNALSTPNQLLASPINQQHQHRPSQRAQNSIPFNIVYTSTALSNKHKSHKQIYDNLALPGSPNQCNENKQQRQRQQQPQMRGIGAPQDHYCYYNDNETRQQQHNQQQDRKHPNQDNNNNTVSLQVPTENLTLDSLRHHAHLIDWFSLGIIKQDVGTPFFSSPEACSGTRFNGFSNDTWALYITWFSIISGILPYYQWSTNDISSIALTYESIRKLDFKWPDDHNIVKIALEKAVEAKKREDERLKRQEKYNDKLYEKNARRKAKKDAKDAKDAKDKATKEAKAAERAADKAQKAEKKDRKKGLSTPTVTTTTIAAGNVVPSSPVSPVSHNITSCNDDDDNDIPDDDNFDDVVDTILDNDGSRIFIENKMNHNNNNTKQQRVKLTNDNINDIDLGLLGKIDHNVSTSDDYDDDNNNNNNKYHHHHHHDNDIDINTDTLNTTINSTVLSNDIDRMHYSSSNISNHSHTYHTTTTLTRPSSASIYGDGSHPNPRHITDDIHNITLDHDVFNRDTYNNTNDTNNNNNNNMTTSVTISCSNPHDNNHIDTIIPSNSPGNGDGGGGGAGGGGNLPRNSNHNYVPSLHQDHSYVLSTDTNTIGSSINNNNTFHATYSDITPTLQSTPLDIDDIRLKEPMYHEFLSKQRSIVEKRLEHFKYVSAQYSPLYMKPWYATSLLQYIHNRCRHTVLGGGNPVDTHMTLTCCPQSVQHKNSHIQPNITAHSTTNLPRHYSTTLTQYKYSSPGLYNSTSNLNICNDGDSIHNGNNNNHDGIDNNNNINTDDHTDAHLKSTDLKTNDEATLDDSKTPAPVPTVVYPSKTGASGGVTATPNIRHPSESHHHHYNHQDDDVIIKASLYSAFKDFISYTFTHTEIQRPTIYDCLNMPWINPLKALPPPDKDNYRK